MIIDGNEVGERSDTKATYDVAIIGTGVVGQTLLRYLEDSGLRIALIESGERVANRSTDDLKEVTTPRYGIGRESRERYLGGSANTWGFGCVKLDAIDFEQRPWVTGSGWPFGRDELEDWYREAARFLRITDPDDLPSPGGAWSFEGPATTTRYIVFTDRLAGFDPSLLDDIADSRSIDLYLNTNAVAIELDESERTVERVRARTLAGAELAIAARTWVLGCGGIENARLLLMSPTRDGRGVGNANDQVGRYFMEHPKGVLGAIVPTDRRSDISPYAETTTGGQTYRGGVSLRAETQRKEQLLNSHARFIVERRWERNVAVRALSRHLRVGPPKTSGADDDEDFPADPVGGIAATAVSVIRNLVPVSLFVLHRLAGRRRPIARIWLKSSIDMEPVPHNRIRLGSEVDALGCPRAVVDYEPTALDRRTVAELHRAIAELVAERGLGRLESPLLDEADHWTIDRDAAHHLGGTRMGDDPSTSVCDPTGRVHGIDNLYVAGSSLFPAGGYANPTLTIVALTIRLANDLLEANGRPPVPRRRSEPLPQKPVDVAGIRANGAGWSSNLPSPRFSTRELQITPFPSVEAAADIWQAFERAGEVLPYQRHGWVSTWCDHLADGVEPRPVAVHDRAGTPLLFLPLGVRRTPSRIGEQRVVGWLAGNLADAWAPIVTPAATPEAIGDLDRFWREVCRAVGGVDRIQIQQVPPKLHELANPLYHDGMRPHARAYGTSLSGPWEDFDAAKRSSKRRKDSQRQLRRLAEVGPVVIERTEPSDLVAMVELAIEQKRAQLIHTGKSDIFAREGMVEFYRQVARDHPELLYVSTMSVGEETIAVNVAAHSGHTVHGALLSNARGSWSRYSPGRLLLEWSLRDCLEDPDINVYDFSIGDGHYKEDWAEWTQVLHREVRPISLRARAASALSRAASATSSLRGQRTRANDERTSK